MDESTTVYWHGVLIPGSTTAIEDAPGERMGLLRNYGVDDLPPVTQDRVLERGGSPIYDPGLMDVMAGCR